LWGSLKFNGPSQFLHEIPSKFYRWDFYQTGSKKSQMNDYSNSYDDFDQTNSFKDSVFEYDKVYQTKKAVSHLGKYPSGSKIIHSLYGEGTVLDSQGLGQDEKVTILFKDGIKKKFMVNFAPLRKV
jgi:DNA helicase-2/ATP-dependent DNA helicase PcrA